MGVFLCLAYYLETTFGRGLDKSTLQSPIFIATSKVCLYFRYRISSPKIVLKIFEWTTAKPKFQLIETVLFSDQEGDASSWGDTTVELGEGVTQFQLVAEKTGLSSNIHYVMVDDVKLSPCPTKGKLFAFILSI